MPAGERRECSRVLVLDNDLGTAELAGSIAKSLGCEVSTSTDPKDALALARAASPDLVVLDSAFPGASGEDFARQLRAAGVAAPLVVMTASPRAAEVAS
jgi:CheY-like chemotaxis protein